MGGDLLQCPFDADDLPGGIANGLTENANPRPPAVHSRDLCFLVERHAMGRALVDQGFHRAAPLPGEKAEGFLARGAETRRCAVEHGQLL